MNFDDKEIIEGCLNRNTKYQKLLYDKYSTPMYNICIRYTKTREDAQDVFQEGFIKVFENLDKFAFRSGFGLWAKKIFITTALNYYRYRHDDTFVPIQNEEIFTLHSHAINNLNNEDLLRIMNFLPDGERMVFNMIEIDGMSIESVCDKMQLAESTIRSMNSRARKKIYNILKDEIGR